MGSGGPRRASLSHIVHSLLTRWFDRRRRPDRPIVVVSGLPRSGTSMLMGMLAAGGLDLLTDGIRTADPDNPKGYYELERVKDLDKGQDTSWLDAARGRGIKVISFLLPHLPDAYDYKVIFVHRHLGEILASQRKMLERRGEVDATSDEEMTRVFAAHLETVERQLNARPNIAVLRIDHHDTVKTPATVARQVADFVGGGLDLERMMQAVDRELYRNRTR